ncbi:conserved hypothetical protein [Ricinus communis]|uniref:Uncharacterized protein n=1 Tax=Ricinus communis TaxID=3988 RepID=B9RPH7_RICCO|nr:conserved hypothetical protein [Ricinus communis]
MKPISATKPIEDSFGIMKRHMVGMKNGAYKKWDINPKDTGLNYSPIELEDMRWQSLDGDFREINDENEQEQAAGNLEKQSQTKGKKRHIM